MSDWGEYMGTFILSALNIGFLARFFFFDGPLSDSDLFLFLELDFFFELAFFFFFDDSSLESDDSAEAEELSESLSLSERSASLSESSLSLPESSPLLLEVLSLESSSLSSVLTKVKGMIGT